MVMLGGKETVEVGPAGWADIGYSSADFTAAVAALPLFAKCDFMTSYRLSQILGE